jgi:hypothetical protein
MAKSKKQESHDPIVDDQIQVEALREEQDQEQESIANQSEKQEDQSDNQEVQFDIQENQETVQENKEDSSIPTNSVTVVIPFKSSVAAGKELLYAVRAWLKYCENVRIVIIGDCPSFLKVQDATTDGIIHIPHAVKSLNPQIDVAQKLRIACESDLVPDYFIVSNDDIYPTSPVTITDLDLQTSGGKLGSRGSAGSTYSKNAARTLDVLKKAGIKSPWDYATHAPVGFHKAPLLNILERFKACEEGYLLATLYFNILWYDYIPILVDNGSNDKHHGTRSYVVSIFRKISAQAVMAACVSRKFLNNNDAGWTSVEPVLKKLFPNKCHFEI